MVFTILVLKITFLIKSCNQQLFFSQIQNFVFKPSNSIGTGYSVKIFPQEFLNSIIRPDALIVGGAEVCV